MPNAMQLLERLERLGFRRNQIQAVRGGSFGGETVICVVHPGSGVEFELTVPQWEVLEPFFAAAEGTGAERMADLRAAARAALDLIEKQIAPGQAAAEDLRNALGG